MSGGQQVAYVSKRGVQRAFRSGISVALLTKLILELFTKILAQSSMNHPHGLSL
jgi:hypothetical protein